MNKPIQTTDDRTQLDKFKDLARELECDEDEAAFKERLRAVAKAPRPEVEKLGE